MLFALRLSLVLETTMLSAAVRGEGAAPQPTSADTAEDNAECDPPPKEGAPRTCRFHYILAADDDPAIFSSSFYERPL